MAKATVYTSEVITAMTSRYEAAPTADTVAALAAELGVTVPSVRSKLASLGIYRKAEAAPKRGKENKEDMADRLRDISGLTLPNIEAAGRVALAELMTHFTRAE